MKISNLFHDVKKEIIIIGVLPIEKEIIENSKEIVKLFRENFDFKLSIYHESDSDLFVRSLYLDSKSSGDKRISFKELQNKISRIDRLYKTFLSVDEERDSIKRIIEKDDKNNKANLMIRQLNLKHTLNIIKVDEKLYTSDVLLDIASIDDYQLEQEQNKINRINKYIKFISTMYDKEINHDGGGEDYLSDPNNNDDELIEMYDKNDIPRGIFPRKAFYNTDFQRYSVWVFVFNRKGQLMLHQRAQKIAKDNAGLWDKSVGGHVDIKDRSSNESAEREVIEEMYLANAEYTKYLKGDTRKFINLGEWRTVEREEEQVLNLFTRMKSDEWGYFYLKPCVRRTSKRRFVEPKNPDKQSEYNWSKTNNNIDYLSKNQNPDYRFFYRDTKFISDIFFFIAPKDEINDDKSVKEIPSSAAKDRMLIEIRELLDWIETEKESGNAEDIFTDDLIYIADQYKDILLGFVDYVKFQRDKLNG